MPLTGIPNVLVSDGISVTKTSPDGTYELETPTSPLNHYSKKFVFVTTPSGYQLDSESFYREVPVPFKEDTQANFGLKESPAEQREFSFAFMADMHIGEGSDKNSAFFQETIDDIKSVNRNIGLDFVASGGDMCYRVMDTYNDNINQIKSDGIPVFNTPGNHDLNEKSDYAGPRKGRFNDYFGPTYYSFDHGDVHFIMLDTTEWVPGIAPSSVIGGVDNARREWLSNDLSCVGEHKPVIIMCHIPMRTTTWERHGPRMKACWEAMNNEEIFDILEKYNVRFIFQGHMHENEHIFEHNTDINSVGAVSGTWWRRNGADPHCPDGSPEGYLLVSVDGEEILPVYKGTGKHEKYQMEMLEPKNSAADEGDVDIVVNFFYGSERSQIFYKIDRGPWKELSRTESPIRDIRIPKTQFFWNTGHIWLASEKRPKGEYNIAVKAIDRHGRVWIQSSTRG